MFQLMKYELRKSMFSKFIMLIALALAEVVFLCGITFTKVEESPVTVIGISLLVVVTIVGISFIGIESLLTLHKDLNTKQSYMLFMTPHNAFQILGAKIIENAVAIFVCAVFFMILAGIDISILLVKLGGYRELILMIQRMMEIDIDWNEILRIVTVVFCEGVVSWFNMVLTGYLAIVLSSSILAGKKISGVVSLGIYLLLVFVQGRAAYAVMRSLPETMDVYGELMVYGGMAAVFALVFYLLSSLMIEKKLSV